MLPKPRRPRPDRVQGPVLRTARLRLDGLTYRARHGVLAAERALGGPFRVDIRADLDHPAAYRDRLADTLDYRDAVRAVERVMTGRPRRTLEFLAQEVCRALLGLRGIRAARVRVTKLSPPLMPGATSAAEISMERA